MKLTSLHIDRFGARSQLGLSDLSPQLNVILGPNGSGKTTIIQFLRWMLFGREDDAVRRYLGSRHAPGCGSLQTQENGHHRTLRRTEGNLPVYESDPRVAASNHFGRSVSNDWPGFANWPGSDPSIASHPVANEVNPFRWTDYPSAGYASPDYQPANQQSLHYPWHSTEQPSSIDYRFSSPQPHDPYYSGRDSHLSTAWDRSSTLPNGVSATEFDDFFCINLDQPHDATRLLRAAKNHRISLQYDQRQLQRIQYLQTEIERLRGELDRTGYPSASAESLRQRRTESLREIESIQAEYRSWRERLERQRIEAVSAVSQQQVEVDRLKSSIREVESAISSREQQLLNELRRWWFARQEALERRAQRVQQLDAQQSRWQATHREIRQRLDVLRSQSSGWDETSGVAEAVDSRFFLQTLDFRLRDLQQDLGATWADGTAWSDWRHVPNDPAWTPAGSNNRHAFSSSTNWMPNAMPGYSSTPSEVWPYGPAASAIPGSANPQFGFGPVFGLAGGVSNPSFSHDPTKYHSADYSALPRVQAMHDEIGRMSRLIEQQQQRSEMLEVREEISYLGRLEHETTQLLDALQRQRDEWAREINDWPAALGSAPPENWHAGSLDQVARSWLQSLRDVALIQLAERREAIRMQLNSAESELASRQRRLSDIETQLQRGLGDERIRVLQREISEIDELLRRLEQQLALQRQIETLSEELRRLRQQMGSSEVIQEAGAILSQLTNGELSALRITEASACQISDRRGQIYDYLQLSRGTRDQVYLAINLALIAAYRRRQIEMPVILNDAFVNLDHDGTQALSRVLSDLAGQDQQMLIFTRHEHILRLFEPLRARMYTLRRRDELASPEPIVRSEPVRPAYVPPEPPTYTKPEPVSVLPEPKPTYRWVAQWHDGRPVAPAVDRATETEPVETAPIKKAPIRRTPVETAPVETAPMPAANIEFAELAELPNSLFSLTSPLTEVPTLTSDWIDRLREIQIHHVDGFLELDPVDGEARMQSEGITAEIIQRRQREILLMLYVGVSPLEGQLLVACGVPDPERLSRADEGVLQRRIETILQRPQAVERFGTATDYSMSRIRGWIDAARRSEYRTRRPRTVLSPFQNVHRESSHRTNGDHGAEKTYAAKVQSTKNQAFKTKPATADEERQTVATVRMDSLRFYLDMTDQVVDAPSIGPKMAERLNQIGVYTVSDLLSAQALDVADQLSEGRVTTETVEHWQLQSKLVCRIPNLRGHDAQILVACGIAEPSELVGYDPQKLLQKVKRFVGSKDGKRIIRGGIEPDLAEVTAWIEWASSARQLRAA